MSANISKRTALGGSISVLALLAGTNLGAQAQTIVDFTAPDTASITGENPANSLNAILSELIAIGTPVSATTENNTIDANSTVVGGGDESSVETDLNSIFAIARGTQ